MTNNHFLRFIAIGLFLLIVSSCSKYDSKPRQYKEKEALDIFMELTPVESVNFYKLNHEINPYFDSLYVETILPLFEEIPLDEFKTVIRKLKETPIEEYAICVYNDVYDDLIAEVADELDSLTFVQQSLFSEEVLPIIEVALDSMICEDLTSVIEEYSGGLLNYRKLALFGGRNSEDFKKKWNEMISPSQYSTFVSDYVSDYIESLDEFQKQYIANVTGQKDYKPIKFKVNQAAILFDNECMNSVNSYNHREKRGMFKDFLKDWVAPAALSVVTGGASAIVEAYEVASLGYDVFVTVDEIRKEEPSSEEILMYECASSLENQVADKILTPTQDIIFELIEKKNEEILYDIAKYYKL